mmetsp:Transcript_8172/g.26094  ORF Transcript_8172/g.26094 Transcript_8172/m.26094 type:complete len:224 (-) Transcript_8172:229-900(-)
MPVVSPLYLTPWPAFAVRTPDDAFLTFLSYRSRRAFRGFDDDRPLPDSTPRFLPMSLVTRRRPPASASASSSAAASAAALARIASAAARSSPARDASFASRRARLAAWRAARASSAAAHSSSASSSAFSIGSRRRLPPPRADTTSDTVDRRAELPTLKPPSSSEDPSTARATSSNRSRPANSSCRARLACTWRDDDLRARRAMMSASSPAFGPSLARTSASRS